MIETIKLTICIAITVISLLFVLFKKDKEMRVPEFIMLWIPGNVFLWMVYFDFIKGYD